jgi:hypothetical protein
MGLPSRRNGQRVNTLPPVSSAILTPDLSGLLRDEGVAVALHVIVRGEDVGLLLGQ